MQGMWYPPLGQGTDGQCSRACTPLLLLAHFVESVHSFHLHQNQHYMPYSWHSASSTPVIQRWKNTSATIIIIKEERVLKWWPEEIIAVNRQNGYPAAMIPSLLVGFLHSELVWRVCEGSAVCSVTEHLHSLYADLPGHVSRSSVLLLQESNNS